MVRKFLFKLLLSFITVFLKCETYLLVFKLIRRSINRGKLRMVKLVKFTEVLLKYCNNKSISNFITLIDHFVRIPKIMTMRTIKKDAHNIGILTTMKIAFLFLKKTAFHFPKYPKSFISFYDIVHNLFTIKKYHKFYLRSAKCSYR